ncbi:MAG: DUF2125 domain-containing protein [Rhizobiaceae bacterium]
MSNHSQRSFLAHPMGKWGLFMLFLFALWFGGWYAFANYADGKIGEVISDVDDRGINIDCDNRQMRGFPFRIGVHCDALNIAHKRDVFRIEMGGIRTAAQLYAPGELVAEIDGPFRSWPNGRELNADWSAMRMFLDANLTGGFELATLTFSDLAASINQAALKVSSGQLHFRPTPSVEGSQDSAPQSLDGALQLASLSAALPRLEVPDATLDADATLIDGYQDLIVRRRPLRAVMRDGAAFDIRNLSLSLPDGGRLAFAGPLSVDDNGLLSGEINVGVAKPQSVADWAGKINPQLAQQVGMITQAVAGMGKPSNFGGTELRSILLTIDKGVVRLGFIQLPEPIPPLFRN